MAEQDKTESLQNLDRLLAQLELWSKISTCQKEITRNYQDMFWGMEPFRELIHLCPEYLQQTINPWNFSLISLTKDMKGKATLEVNIVRDVASYGSQLGTIIDFLQLLAKKTGIDGEALTDENKVVLDKFNQLAQQIEEIKNKTD